MKLLVPEFLRKNVHRLFCTSPLSSSSESHSQQRKTPRFETNLKSNGTSFLLSVGKGLSGSRKASSFEAYHGKRLPEATEVPSIQATGAEQEITESEAQGLRVPLPPLHDYRHELEEAFIKLDENQDGKISVSELGTLLRSLGDDPSDEELRSMVKEADSNGDGFIDLQEFILINTATLDTSTEDLREAFSVFDANADGKISSEDLHQVLSKLGESSSMEECGRMIQRTDRDEDGFVDFREFCTLMSLQ